MGCLVQVKHNGKSGHEEEDRDNAELVAPDCSPAQLPIKPHKAEQQGKGIIDIAAGILPEHIGHL